MAFYTSARERRLWMWSLAVFAAIFATLFVGQPLLELFSDQNVRAVIFLIVMALVGATILVHAIKQKPSRIELTVLLGIMAVYVMFILRLGMPERSHLMEYSVLAIVVHSALLEQAYQGKKIPMPALLAFFITFMIGVLDEVIQIFLPNRVFDPEDIIFNGMAIALAIGASVLMSFVRQQIAKRKLHH